MPAVKRAVTSSLGNSGALAGVLAVTEEMAPLAPPVVTERTEKVYSVSAARPVTEWEVVVLLLLGTSFHVTLPPDAGHPVVAPS